jgi:cell division protein FtsN
MQQLKDRFNNYSVPPPEGAWDEIAAQLDAEKPSMGSSEKVNRTYYLFAAAAALIVVVAGYMLFTIFSNPAEKQVVSSSDSLGLKNNDLANNNTPVQAKVNNESLMRVPDKELSTIKNKDRITASAKSSSPQKQVNPEKKDSKEIKNNRDSVEVNGEPKTNYITIAGPEGQPVKVSEKAAALIESSDEKIPPHTVWNKKINKWRDIMKTNTLAPTPGNFLDIVELNNTLVDKKRP